MGCLYMGWSVSIRDGMFVNGMACYFTGWGVRIEDAVLVYWM